MSKKLDEILSKNSVPTDRFNSLFRWLRMRSRRFVALMKMSGTFTGAARTRPLSDFL